MILFNQQPPTACIINCCICMCEHPKFRFQRTRLALATDQKHLYLDREVAQKTQLIIHANVVHNGNLLNRKFIYFRLTGQNDFKKGSNYLTLKTYYNTL